MNWTEECAERWTRMHAEGRAGAYSLREAVEGAIREALEKAAEVAARPLWDSVESIVDAIRALGAK